MSHLPQFLHDLAFILITAAICILIFRILKLPSVIGFILAGFFVGPNVAWMPTALDQVNIQLWGEIGVLFILFGLGLEMSFKKLFSLGGKAVIISLIEVLGVFFVGVFLGKILGMESTACYYLGATLSISSTSIILRAFNELKLKNSAFSGTVFGVLIVEDLLAVIMMILLLGKGMSESFNGLDLAEKIAQLLFFIILWGGLGRYLIPWLLRQFEKHLNDEALLLVSVGLCFAMVGVASSAGLSAALGAFMMGSILAETKYIHQIEKLFHPLKIFFSAVFFVSVGMLLSPQQLMENWKLVIILSSVVIVGKLFFASLGTLLVGETLKNSLSVGSSMTQIGEFSFIIAMMGQNSKILEPHFYPVIVGVSTLTSLLTPLWIVSVQKLFSPSKTTAQGETKNIKVLIENYRIQLKVLELDPSWGQFVKSYSQSVLLNSTFILGIHFFIKNYAFPWISEIFYSYSMGTTLSIVGTFIFISPFLWMMTLGKISKLTHVAKFKFANSKWFVRIVVGSRFIFAFVFSFVILGQYLSIENTVLGLGILILLSPLVVKFYPKLYKKLEFYFINHVQEKEQISIESKTFDKLYQPWDLQLHHVSVPERSKFIGKTLAELQLREDWQINLVILERSLKSIVAPQKNEILMPMDKLHLVADEEQFQNFCEHLESEAPVDQELDIVMHPFLTTSRSPWLQKELKHSLIREMTDGLVIGVEKAGNKILNPKSDVVLELGDLIWIVGEKKKVLSLLNENQEP